MMLTRTTRVLALSVATLAVLALAACDQAGDNPAAAESTFAPLEGEYQGQCMERCQAAELPQEECDRMCNELDVNPCFQSCLDEGGDEVGCRVRCYGGDGIDGEGACDEAVAAAYEQCITAGGEEEICRERAAEAFDACAGADVVACYQECLDGGGDEEGCRVRCYDGDGIDGESACDEAGTAAYDGCIAAGGGEESCRERAAEAFDACAGADVEACYEECLDGGGDEEGCRTRCYDGE